MTAEKAWSHTASDGSLTGHIADPDDTDYCLFCEVRLTDANRWGRCSAQNDQTADLVDPDDPTLRRCPLGHRLDSYSDWCEDCAAGGQL